MIIGLPNVMWFDTLRLNKCTVVEGNKLETSTVDYIIKLLHKYPVAFSIMAYVAGLVSMYIAFLRGHVSTPSIMRRLAKVEHENKMLLEQDEIRLNDMNNMQRVLDNYRKRDAEAWQEDRKRIRELEEKLRQLT